MYKADDHTIEQRLRTDADILSAGGDSGTSGSSAAENRQAMAQKLWNQPFEKAQGDEWYLDGLQVNAGPSDAAQKARSAAGRSFGRRSFFPAAAAFLLFFGIMFYQFNLHTAATVCLDSEDSVTFTVNRLDQVTSVTVTKTGAHSVEGASSGARDRYLLKNVDDAVTAAIEDMTKQDAAEGSRPMLLLSVQSDSRDRKEIMRRRLTDLISRSLDASGGAVFDQDLDDLDDELEDLAEQYGTTPGRILMVMKITEDHPELRPGDLYGLSVYELAILLKNKGIDMRDYAGYQGYDYYDDPEDAIEDALEDSLDDDDLEDITDVDDDPGDDGGSDDGDDEDDDDA